MNTHEFGVRVAQLSRETARLGLDLRVNCEIAKRLCDKAAALRLVSSLPRRQSSRNLTLIGIRSDGSRKVLASGLTQEQAVNVVAWVGTAAFVQFVVEDSRPAS